MYKKLTFTLLIGALALLWSCKKDSSSNKIIERPYLPPGKYLLFDADEAFNTGRSSFPSLYTSIYYANLDGTGITRITPIEPTYYSYRASWSPDGTQILYTRGDYADTSRGICTIDITGRNFKRIIKGDEADYGSFSPLGNMVAYAKSLVHTRPYRYDVYIANADGTSEHRLTYFADDNGAVANIHWSVDGKIYFNAGSNRSKSGIYSVDKDGNLKYIMYGGGFLGVSQDGKSLLFDESNGMFSSNTDGSNIKTLITYDDNNPNMLLGASWSADGSLIFLSNTNLSANLLGIFKVNSEGYGFQKVLDGFYEYPTIH
jgi:Tol biopolymer transport system component